MSSDPTNGIKMLVFCRMPGVLTYLDSSRYILNACRYVNRGVRNYVPSEFRIVVKQTKVTPELLNKS